MTDRTEYSDLRPGDRFQQYDEGGRNRVTVEVLAPPEPWTNEPFGRSGFWRTWMRRLDTNAEGWLYSGPGGTVRLEERRTDPC